MGSLTKPASQPAGKIEHFAMASAPSGWLKANGAVISRSAYAALFAAIGITYGAGDGATTFAIPDLRGEFLRGLDDGRGIDAGRSIGTAQAQDLTPHTHTFATGYFGASTGSGYTPPTISGGVGGSQSTGVAGTTENRPRNIALLVCIKY